MEYLVHFISIVVVINVFSILVFSPLAIPLLMWMYFNDMFDKLKRG